MGQQKAAHAIHPGDVGGCLLLPLPDRLHLDHRLDVAVWERRVVGPKVGDGAAANVEEHQVVRRRRESQQQLELPGQAQRERTGQQRARCEIEEAGLRVGHIHVGHLPADERLSAERVGERRKVIHQVRDARRTQLLVLVAHHREAETALVLRSDRQPDRIQVEVVGHVRVLTQPPAPEIEHLLAERLPAELAHQRQLIPAQRAAQTQSHLGHHSKVAAASAAQCPEEVRPVAGVGAHHGPVGAHHARLQEVVATQTVAPGEEAPSTAQHEATDTHLWTTAAHRQ
mmetsp:Transcript_5699/g.14483  ORF Transcript_5699/g.14483 Transcript_5699/m.14483 type:complete len:285 (-) Transcript_5699:858-1712(-)